MCKTKQFIEKSKTLHGEKYGYSNVQYVNAVTYVTIDCPIHGPFNQKPRDHVQGCGCPKCGGKLRHTISSFTEEAQRVHNTKYDYSLVEYVNNSTPVNIICYTHGIFAQTPNSHLSGRGCPVCGGTRSLTTADFIEKSREVHGDRYDYSLVSYCGIDAPVRIICGVHGIFLQTPNNHVHGKYGCPACGNTHKDGKYNQRYFDKFPDRKMWPATLYVVRFSNNTETFVKVGITTQSTIRHRFRMSIYDGYLLEVVGEYKSTLYDCWCKEQQLLSLHLNHRYVHQHERAWYGKNECLMSIVEPSVMQFLKCSVDPNAILDDNIRMLIDRRTK